MTDGHTRPAPAPIVASTLESPSGVAAGHPGATVRTQVRARPTVPL